MTREEIFRVWAPATSPWSPWVAPVLFARIECAEERTPPAENSPVDLGGFQNSAGTAVIVDLPGACSLEFGLALAQHGCRPVPLYNGSPGPTVPAGSLSTAPEDFLTLSLKAAAAAKPVAAIDMGDLLLALCRGTQVLRQLQFSPEAPPAFLLDANRLLGTNPIREGIFDNRWMIFPQDFPSAGFLASRGIKDVLLVQKGRQQPQEDLSHVLLRWQESGITISARDLMRSGNPQRIAVTRPSRFRRAWYRALAIVGLRRNSTGGFGSVIPDSSAG